MANTGETRSRERKEKIGLSQIGTNLYDSLSNKDNNTHTYDDISAIFGTTLSDGKGRQTAIVRATTPRSEVIVTRRSEVTRMTIVLAVIGTLLLSTLITVIACITVYHVTIAKMADSDKQEEHITSWTVSPIPADALAMMVKRLENNLTTATDARSKEIATLKNDLNTASEERKSLKNDIDTASEERKSLKNDLNTASEERNALKNDLNTASEERKSLKKDIDTASEERKSLKNDLNTASEERKSLKNELDTASEERKSLKNNLDTASEERKSFKNDIDTASEERKSLKNELNTASEERKSLKNDIDTASEERKSLKNDIDMASEERKSLKNELDTASEERKSLKNELDTESEERKSLKNELDTASEERKSLKRDIDTASEERKSLKNELDTASEERKSLKDHLNSVSEGITELKKTISNLRQNYRKDCSELYAAGSVEDGVYTISSDGKSPFHVYCDMTGGGWTMIQARIDGSVNFRRTWDEYVEGFGNIDGEHWLGLDNIHRLTADGSQIYFYFEYYNGTTGFAHYHNFSVHDATTAYRLNVDASGYNGTIEEFFSYHNNMTFSTYDRDNDHAPKSYNCAKEFGGGGWWYNACYKLGNLNGVYGKREQGGIAYSDWKNDIHLKSVNIKVKPSKRYPSEICQHQGQTI